MYILKSISAAFLILTSASVLSAQTGKLIGTVKDSTGKPVESANVIIQDTKLVTSTDRKGSYQIENVPIGNYSVIVTIIGYKSMSDKITIRENETNELNFHLNQKVVKLKEVSIIGAISINGMGHLAETHDGVIYSGMKTEVLALDSIDANTAQNNPREILGRIPGSNYSETEGGGFPSNGIAFRGLVPTQSIELQTRQNGYNIAGDVYGYPESYYLPPLEAVDRIEVIRGASSLQFGPQFGGVINYILKNGPEDKPLEVTTSQTGGSYGFFDSYTSVGGTYKKWNYFSYIQYKSSDGFRPNSDVRQVTGFGKIEYRATDKFKIGLEYSLLRNRIHMPGGLDDAQFAQGIDQSFRARNWLRSPWNILVLTSEYRLSDKTLITFKSAFNSSARDLVWRNEDGGIQTPDSISPITNNFVQREVEHEGFKSLTTELRVLTHYNIGGVEQTLGTGLRYFQGFMKRQEGGAGSTGSDFDMNLYNPDGALGGVFANDLNFSTTNIAPFIENTFHIGNRLSITPGLRYEYIQSTVKGYITTDTAGVVHSDLVQHWYLPLAGIGVQMKTGVASNVYANISETYQPTDYSALTPVGSNSQIDPHLKDVSGYNADCGWRGKIKEFLNFDVGLFYLTFNGEIGPELRYDINNQPYTYVTNVGNSVHEGVETYIEVNPFKKFASTSKIGTISFFNSYAYIHATYVSGPYQGNVEEMAPKNIDRCGVTYSLKNFSTTFLFSSVSKSYGTADNTSFSADATAGLIPTYQVMDWSSKIHIKNYTIKLGISNLTNVKYFNLRTGEYPGPGIIPAIGRSPYVGFGATF